MTDIYLIAPAGDNINAAKLLNREKANSSAKKQKLSPIVCRY